MLARCTNDILCPLGDSSHKCTIYVLRIFQDVVATCKRLWVKGWKGRRKVSTTDCQVCLQFSECVPKLMQSKCMLQVHDAPVHPMHQGNNKPVVLSINISFNLLCSFSYYYNIFVIGLTVFVLGRLYASGLQFVNCLLQFSTENDQIPQASAENSAATWRTQLILTTVVWSWSGFRNRGSASLNGSPPSKSERLVQLSLVLHHFGKCHQNAIVTFELRRINKKAQLTQRERATAVHVWRPTANKM